MSYDPACADLAKYFLGDLATDRLVTNLSQAIQDRVEDWLSYEQRELEQKLAGDDI